jgi:hypothetical protein
MEKFSAKFIDIMIGVVLGLGFQWLPILHAPWQITAFIFAYIDIVDYWIDYGPALKKFPPKREVDVLLDVAIVLAIFLYIYTTQVGIIAFLGAFILFRLFDYLWLLSSKYEFSPTGTVKKYVDTWLMLDLIEIGVTAVLVWFTAVLSFNPLPILVVYIIFRLLTRVFASLRYRKSYF